MQQKIYKQIQQPDFKTIKMWFLEMMHHLLFNSLIKIKRKQKAREYADEWRCVVGLLFVRNVKHALTLIGLMAFDFCS